MVLIVVRGGTPRVKFMSEVMIGIDMATGFKSYSSGSCKYSFVSKGPALYPSTQ